MLQVAEENSRPGTLGLYQGPIPAAPAAGSSTSEGLPSINTKLFSTAMWGSRPPWPSSSTTSYMNTPHSPAPRPPPPQHTQYRMHRSKIEPAKKHTFVSYGVGKVTFIYLFASPKVWCPLEGALAGAFPKVGGVYKIVITIVVQQVSGFTFCPNHQVLMFPTIII